MRKELNLSTLDRSLQLRVRMDPRTVERYREAYQSGDDLPPPLVFGEHGRPPFLLADGFHRVDAWTALGHDAMVVEVRDGDRRVALEHAAGANKSHGLPLSREDKRAAITMLLADEVLAERADRDLARLVGVSHTFVAHLRRGPKLAERIASGNVATSDAMPLKNHAPQVLAALPAGLTWEDVDRSYCAHKISEAKGVASIKGICDVHGLRYVATSGGTLTRLCTPEEFAAGYPKAPIGGRELISPSNGYRGVQVDCKGVRFIIAGPDSEIHLPPHPPRTIAPGPIFPSDSAEPEDQPDIEALLDEPPADEQALQSCEQEIEAMLDPDRTLLRIIWGYRFDLKRLTDGGPVLDLLKPLVHRLVLAVDSYRSTDMSRYLPKPKPKSKPKPKPKSKSKPKPKPGIKS